MATFYVDPTWTGTKSGTLAQPYDSWATVAALPPTAGNKYLQKRGTTWAGSLGPLGTGGTAGNEITFGVYEPATGEQVRGVKGAASINATGQSFGINIAQARPYVTVSGLEIYGATSANITKTSTASSSTEAQFLTIEDCILRDGVGVGADLRGRGNRVLRSDINGNGSDGLFIVGDDFELGWCNVKNNGRTNSEGDCAQIRDGSNWYVHHSLLDHSQSAFKQAFLSTLEFVLGTTGGRMYRCTVLTAQYVAGVTQPLKTLQVLTPGVTIEACTISGGEYGVVLEADDARLISSVVRVTGSGPAIGVLVKALNVTVQNNTVLGGAGLAGSIGIDHNSATYTGAVIRNNVLTDWQQAIRTAATGAIYSNNAFDRCAVRNSNLAGAEGAAGAGDLVGSLKATPDYRLLPGSPLLTGGADLGMLRDINRRQSRRHIGAHAAATMTRNFA